MSDPKPVQRDVMRLLYKDHEGDKVAVVTAYAKAEGRVARDSNEHKFDATAYAEASKEFA